MSNKLTLTEGLPGSGKSYWAKQYVLDHPDTVRCNRDDLRNMRGKYWLPKQEKLITEWQTRIVLAALEAGHNVILDDTNLNPTTKNHWINVVSKFNAGLPSGTIGVIIEIKSFTDVPLETCIKRDNDRVIGRVGEKVIKDMYNKYLNPLVGYKQDPLWPHLLISDLDGTLCLFGNKSPYERDFINDQPNYAVVETIRNYQAAHPNNPVFFFSGRSDKYIAETKAWLIKNGFDINDTVKYKLVMRKHDDPRKDSIVKREFFDTYVRGKYYVDLVLDDRNQVVELWRDLGLSCFQVADGNF